MDAGKDCKIGTKPSFEFFEMADEIMFVLGLDTPEWMPKLNTILELEKPNTSKVKSGFNPKYKTLLALVDDFRTIDWVQEYPFPSIALAEIKSLLT